MANLVFPYTFNNNGAPTPLELTASPQPLFFDPVSYPGSYPPAVGNDAEKNYRQDLTAFGAAELILDIKFNGQDEIIIEPLESRVFDSVLVRGSLGIINPSDTKERLIKPQSIKILRVDWEPLIEVGRDSIEVPILFAVPTVRFLQIFIRHPAPLVGAGSLIKTIDLLLGHSI